MEKHIVRNRQISFLAAVASIATALASPAAHAGQTNSYDVDMVVRNRGQLGTFAQILGGWSCSSSANLSYSDVMRDQNGRSREVQHTSASDYSFSTLFFGQPSAHMSLEQNMYNQSPRVEASLTQRCSKESCHTVVRDGRSEEDCDTKWFSKTWGCSISELPSAQNPSNRVVCDHVTSGWSDFSLSSMVTSSFQDIEIEANLKFKGAQETFLFNNCGGNRRNAVVIHVDQGLGGHIGEDDFSIKLDVNGERISIPTRSGLLAGDILYCSANAGEPLTINASGIEEDMFFDDIYENDGTALHLGRGDESTIRLRRRRLLGGYTYSNVRIQVQPYENPTAPRANPALR